MLRWFRARRRDLPWRQPDTGPYHTWVSEIMLQQTRVEVVVPFYEAFLEKFPTVSHLAQAEEEQLLRAWAGLGYYRRARLLQRAARAVVEQHGGDLPESAEALRALPGIGEYTAAAIASIAFGEPVPVVDGNVKRVVARQTADPTAADARALYLASEDWGAGLMRALPATRLRGNRAGDLNQALMELGATVCTPRRPACERCPIVEGCAAHEAGEVERFPGPKAPKEWKEVELDYFLARRGSEVLLVQREEGWNPGLYEPPSCPRSAESDRPEWRGPGRPGAALGTLRHTITRHRITAHVHALELGDRHGMDDPLWVRAETVPLSALGRKILSRFGGLD